MIENRFVYIPETIRWLAEYLRETAAFPKASTTIRSISTAQFLDWLKRPYPGAHLRVLQPALRAAKDLQTVTSPMTCARGCLESRASMNKS
jgi:hypothetical protein